jgi:pilus assembly protein Flp/PilA
MQDTPRTRLWARRSDRGASAVEYGLVLVGIAGLLVTILFALGPVSRESYDHTCDQLSTETGGSGDCV